MEPLEKQRTTINIRSWPTPQEYNEAVQNLHENSGDIELQSGHIETGLQGLPLPRSGSFASVYRVQGKDRAWALRCFLREMPDAQARYHQISQYVSQDDLSYTVGFDLQPRGIRVGSRWFPALKMEWVEGETLDNYVRARHGKVGSELADSFMKMCIDLQAAGIAHGDLQHGNIIIRDEQLYLVDYDGMYVPGMDGWRSNELGHRNYQHPRRNANTFGTYLDNFSAWNIYCSLKALSVDPTLFERLQCGDDCLLFRSEDFIDPLNSCAFAALETSDSPELVLLGRYIRHQASELLPDQIPPLQSAIATDFDLPPLNPNVPIDRASLSMPGANDTAYPVSAESHSRPKEFFLRQTPPTDLNNMPIIPSGAIEPELSQSPPRQITKSDARVKIDWLLTLSGSTILALSFAAAFFPPPCPWQLYLLLWIFILCVVRIITLFTTGRSADLVRWGKATRGRIIKIERAEKDKLNVTYRYFDEKAGTHLVNVMSVPDKLRSKLPVEVTILYRPGTSRSAIYTGCDTRAIRP